MDSETDIPCLFGKFHLWVGYQHELPCSLISRDEAAYNTTSPYDTVRIQKNLLVEIELDVSYEI